MSTFNLCWVSIICAVEINNNNNENTYVHVQMYYYMPCSSIYINSFTHANISCLPAWLHIILYFSYLALRRILTGCPDKKAGQS